ncbi:Dabb family protein [Streptomyces sp. NPDC047072]|uniref:Dabb family protein n=1 Tax=Streptomyces sp. NPDC047072 TaxID=3154809 RepID=UPI0033DC09A8
MPLLDENATDHIETTRGDIMYHLFEGLTLKPGTSPEAFAAIVANVRELVAGVPAIASSTIGPAHPAHAEEHSVDIAMHLTFETEEARNTFYFHDNCRIVFQKWVVPNLAGTPLRVEFSDDRTAPETDKVPMPPAPWFTGDEGFGDPVEGH